MNIFNRKSQVGNVLPMQNQQPKQIIPDATQEERIENIKNAFAEQEQPQQIQPPEQQSEEQSQEIAEIISCDIDEKFGIVYKVRSNNPDFHLGLCQLEQD